ncbi:MAG TPA: hypothetical protein VJQ47_09945 [Steroidobacteraceae bacterium]|nr:hypothetical protein [Steroidobacteraceae bacterium]
MTLICLSPNGVDTCRLPRAPDTMLVATVGGVIRLVRDPAAAAWNVDGHSLIDVHVGSLLQDPTRGFVFAGSYSAGLFRSRDEGRTWESVSEGLGHLNVYSLASSDTTNAARPFELYVGTQPAHLYRSRDHGDTWEELTALASAPGHESWGKAGFSQPAHVRHIACHPTAADTLYVCVGSGGLLRTDDSGRHFRALECQSGDVALHAHARRIVFSPCNPDEVFLQSSRGVARSLDSGGSWTVVPTSDYGVSYPGCLHCAPEGDGVVFLAGARTERRAWKETGDADSTMTASHDGGRTWTRVRGGLPRFTGNVEAVTLVTWPAGFGLVVATTDGEVFGSTNKGETWKQLAEGLPPISTRAHYEDLAAGRLYMQHVYAVACRVC